MGAARAAEGRGPADLRRDARRREPAEAPANIEGRRTRESARFLKKYGNWFVRFFLPGGYSPDRLVEGLTPLFTDPESNVRGFHVYTFNEVGKTEAWRREKLDGILAA